MHAGDVKAKGTYVADFHAREVELAILPRIATASPSTKSENMKIVAIVITLMSASLPVILRSEKKFRPSSPYHYGT